MQGDLTSQFSDFISECLSYDHTQLLGELKRLVALDDSLGEEMKNRLLKISEQAELAAFMAELYVFIVMYTDNRSDRATAPTSAKVMTLLEKIHKTVNNAELRKLAQRAIYDEDFISLGSCLSKMSNEIYIPGH